MAPLTSPGRKSRAYLNTGLPLYAQTRIASSFGPTGSHGWRGLIVITDHVWPTGLAPADAARGRHTDAQRASPPQDLSQYCGLSPTTSHSTGSAVSSKHCIV